MSQSEVDDRDTELGRRTIALEECLDHGLFAAVAYSGGEMTGMSFKCGEDDYLLTIRALFPAGHMVSHVGGVKIADVLLKASRDGFSDKLDWSKDKYR